MAKDVLAGTNLLSSTLDFMSSNLVVTVSTGLPKGVHSFMLDDSLGEAHASDGSIIQGYYLMPGDKSEGCFDAYWCPYVPSSIRSVVVGKDARLMFTATMDGCSLGVGSRTQNGERLVSHSNEMGAVDFIYDTLEARGKGHAALMVARSHQQYLQQQRLATRQSGDAGMTIVDPTKYRRDAEGKEVLKSTTFGVKNPDGQDWGFYAHQYDDSKFFPVLIGVAFVAGARPS